MKFKKFICLLILTSLVLSTGITASARTPYANYYIQEKEKTAKPIPAAYETSTVIDFLSTETGKLKNPEDMFIDDEGKIYVADTGNNRIVVYGADYKFLFEISSDGTYVDGDLSALKDPTGVYVDPDDGAIIVADSGNGRIVEFTKYGNLRYSYSKPESDLLSKDFSYQPEKITKDSRGFMYVTNKGDSNGIMQLSSNGEFISYYGTNKVNLSFWESLAKLLWSREDRKGSVVTLPYTFTNIYSSADGYMYATTTTETPPQVRKINIGGSDVLYGAYDFRDNSIMSSFSTINQIFCDVTVDKYNNMLIVDRQYGRIYEYDERGNNLFAFGTKGNGYGQLSYPVSIETDGNGRVYVLNKTTGNITVFKPTEFANLVHVANAYYSDGKYEESLKEWEKVVEKSNYYSLALVNIGNIKLREEFNSEAYDFFYEAENATYASEAYEEMRADFLRDYFSWIVITIVVLLALWVAVVTIKKFRRKKYGVPVERKNFFTAIKHFFGRVTNIMRHPVDGFEEIRYENQGSYLDMIAIMILYAIVSVISAYATSFIYRGGASLDTIEPVLTFFFAFLPWGVVCIVNYGVTTIMYGEGRFRDVVIGGAYCHGPLMLLSLPYAALTHLLTLNESGIYGILGTLLTIYTIALVYFCIKGIHGFHPVKAFVVFMLTAVGVVAVVLLFLIVYGLAAQMFDFIIQFGKEMIYLV
ncbi:MAG: YIP1 family protein [Clostridia bacterium]|nr:YIP1 family protein [Clostridia bacterium]